VASRTIAAVTDSIRRLRPFLAIVAVVAIVAGCSGAAATKGPNAAGPAGPSLDIITITPRPTSAPGDPQASPTMPSWFGVPMTDVNTGRSFTIQDFAGKVVLVEAIATWCPTCQGELSQVKQLLADVGRESDLVAVALDVDPNEDAALLKKYAQQNGFTFVMAVAPEDVIHFLITNYDQSFVNPPLVPMLFIDREGGVWGLPNGTKSASSLKQTLDPYLAAK
jgi:cytochrome oxidase Cu insertion factor (SCO1/SenC/PrrC family)